MIRRVTIVAGGSRNFPGYSIRCYSQVGCATTEDDPSEETTTAAQEDARKTLDRISGDVARAWDLFRHGSHPFTLTRKHLADGHPGGPASEPLAWTFADVYIHVRPETAPVVQMKIAIDFQLCLMTDPEFRRAAPHLRQSFEKESLASLLTSPFALPNLIVKAGRNDAALRELTASPQPSDDGALERWFRANALLRAIGGKPYGELVELARNRKRDLWGLPLLLFASERHGPELPKVLSGFDAPGRAYAGPLLA